MEQEALSEIRRPVLLIPVNEVNRMKKNGLLEIIAAHRTIADLDEILKKDKYYQDVMEDEQRDADIMES